eukprot:2515967-Prymnesium_polylepis.1
MAISSVWHHLSPAISTPRDDSKQCEHLLTQEFQASYSDWSHFTLSYLISISSDLIRHPVA